MWYNSILDVIGNTPLVRINKLNPNPNVTLLAKLEFFNPGGSIKDRIAITMIGKAVKEGKLKKGGTIVEPTSGNTGAGLAQLAAVKGYKSVFVMPDKMSEEKRNLLRAYGAKVVVTPTAVSPEDERSYYRVSDRLSRQKGAYKPDQYHNPANPEAHYKTTGPEIWEQTEGKITHLVIGMGTGGTITGIGKFLKEKNPKIHVIGIDPVGSVYAEYFKTKKLPKLFKTYKVEGVGEDFLPTTIDFRYIDDVIAVADRDCFFTARALAAKEGILAGGSSGMALHGALQVAKKLKSGCVVVIFPDSGRNYLSKFYNNEWMRDFGFFDEEESALIALLAKKLHFIAVSATATPQEAVTLMKKHNISQMPVLSGKMVVGIVSERVLLTHLFGKEKIPVSVSDIMEKNVKQLPISSSFRELAAALSDHELVVITDKHGKPLDVVTRIDLLTYVTKMEGAVS